MPKIKVVRGIERDKTSKKDRVRVEPGKVHARSWLESRFSKKTVANWLKTGVLEAVEEEGE